MNCNLTVSNCSLNYTDKVRNFSLESVINLNLHPLTRAGTIAFLVVSVILFLLILGGNLLIMIAFGMNKSLRNLSNYFLVSLAVADFLTGLISLMPFSVYASLSYWPFGKIVCDLWIIMDNGIVTSSTLNLLVICLDRYMAVKWSLAYRARRTKRKVFIIIAAVWIISFLFWMPMLVVLRSDHENATYFTNDCYIAYLYSNNYVFMVIVSAVAFWIPCVVMVGLYQRVYQATLNHKSFIRKHVRRRSKYKVSQLQDNVERKVSIIGTESEKNLCMQIKTSVDMTITRPYSDRNDRENKFCTTETAKARLESTTDNYKAAKMLTAIIIAYTITWIPWKSLMIIYYFCKDCIPSTVYFFVYFLVYVNSSVNPFLYAVCNNHFKKTFIQILMCCRMK